MLPPFAMSKVCLLWVLALSPLVLEAQTAVATTAPSKATKVWTNEDFSATRDATHPDALPAIGYVAPARPRTQPVRAPAITRRPASTANVAALEAQISRVNARISELQKEDRAVRERLRFSINPRQRQTLLSNEAQIERKVAVCRGQVQGLEGKLAGLEGLATTTAVR